MILDNATTFFKKTHNLVVSLNQKTYENTSKAKHMSNCLKLSSILNSVKGKYVLSCLESEHNLVLLV